MSMTCGSFPAPGPRTNRRSLPLSAMTRLLMVVSGSKGPEQHATVSGGMPDGLQFVIEPGDGGLNLMGQLAVCRSRFAASDGGRCPHAAWASARSRPKGPRSRASRSCAAEAATAVAVHLRGLHDATARRHPPLRAHRVKGPRRVQDVGANRERMCHPALMSAQVVDYAADGASQRVMKAGVYSCAKVAASRHATRTKTIESLFDLPAV